MLIDSAYGRALPGRMLHIDLPDTSTVEGAKRAAAVIVRSAASGEITPGEAADLCSILDAQQRAIELADVEERVRQLEQKNR